MRKKFEYNREIQEVIAKKFLDVMIPVMLIASVLSLISGLYMHTELSRIVVVVTIGIFVLSTIGIRKHFSNHVGVSFLLIGIIAVLSFAAVINGGFQAPAFIGILTMTALVGWMYSARVTICYGFYLLGLAVVILLLQESGTIRQIPEASSLFYLINYSIFACILVVGVVISNRQLHESLFSSKEQANQLRDTMDELLQSKDDFHASLDFFPIPIAITKSNGDTIYHNRAFFEHFGYTIEDLPTVDSWIDTVYESPEYRDEIIGQWRKDVAEAVASGKTSNISVHKILASDGKPLVVEISMQPIGDHFVHVLNDITERYFQQRKHQTLLDQLHQSQKMEAVGQLAGGVAHDFNNALGGIIGATELIKMGGSTEEELDQYCELILTAANRAGNLTKKLLTFSRKGSKITTAIDVCSVVNETAELLKHTINKNIIVKVENHAAETMIIGDDSLLQNAFMNMGINASHVMPDGGELTFILENNELDEVYCEVSPFALTPGKYVEVAVRDSGSGMSPEILSRIFEPFFTTKEAGKGTGLGLAAVYGTVQEHGGAITVYSEVGQGTVFHLFFPITGESIKTPVCEQVVAKGCGTILVIDDEELIRITASALLVNLGYKVICAENGLEGVNTFAEIADQVDLVILDMIMPVMGGREAFEKLREIRPNIPVVIASGFAKDEDMAVLHNRGISGFLHKPFRREVLAEMVAGAMNAQA